MIWTTIVLTLICLYLGVLLRRRDAKIETLEFYKEQFEECKLIAKDAVEINRELIEAHRDYVDDSEFELKQMTDLAWTALAERDAAHKMLEVVLDEVPARCEDYRQITTEIGINGVVYQFHKEHMLTAAT